MYGSLDIRTEIKATSLRWVGNIPRINERVIVKRLMDSKSEERKKILRPINRWMDGVLQDVRNLEINNWWMLFEHREDRKRILKEAMTQLRLLYQI